MKLSARWSGYKPAVEYVERGAAVAGTGKPSASSKATGKGR